jgi:hypothetical protein
MKNMSEGSSAYCPEGVVDVSIIVVSLFRNPLGEEAVKFLRDVLSRRTKAAIPVTSVLGAFPRGHEVLKASSSERGGEARENAGDEIAGFLFSCVFIRSHRRH